jgi:hypothetical protein
MGESFVDAYRYIYIYIYIYIYVDRSMDSQDVGPFLDVAQDEFLFDIEIDR